MPTERLNDSERNWIKQQVNSQLFKAKYLRPFPLSKPVTEEWFRDLFPKRELVFYQELKRYNDNLVMGNWRDSGFTIRGYKTRYGVQFDYTVPDTMPMTVNVDVNNNHFNDILTWVRSYAELNKDLRRAQGTLSVIVNHCTTTGQLARVLPDELVQKLPNSVKNSLGNAIRKSRWPQGLATDIDDRIEHLSNMLTLASLAAEPDNDLVPAINRVTTKEME